MRLLGGVDRETGDVVLLADANGFIALAGVLRSPKPTTMRLESAVGRSAVEPLVYLRLEIAAQLLSVSVSGDAVTLRGARHDYSRIASEIEEFIELNDLEEPGVLAWTPSALTGQAAGIRSSWASFQMAATSRGVL